MEWDPIKKQYVFKPIANPMATMTAPTVPQTANKYDAVVPALGAASNLTSTASGGGSPVSGALSGAGAGAALGSAIAPGIGTLIGAGAGAIVGGVGAGMTGGAEDEKDKRNFGFKEREQEEIEKNNAALRKATTRKMNMQGIDQLATMRTNAMQNMRGQMFKNDLIRAISG